PAISRWFIVCSGKWGGAREFLARAGLGPKCEVLRFGDRRRPGPIASLSAVGRLPPRRDPVTWNGKRFDWTNVIYFAVVHVCAVWALWTFTWTGLAVFAALLWLAFSLGIGVTYHRLLTHRGFTVPKPLEYLFTICGMLSSEGGAITWVAM